jgi:hypothetical protein
VSRVATAVVLCRFCGSSSRSTLLRAINGEWEQTRKSCTLEGLGETAGGWGGARVGIKSDGNNLELGLAACVVLGQCFRKVYLG